MVNTALSDLFFNHDVTSAVITNNKGECLGYDEVKLLGEAEIVLELLESLGVSDLPTKEELVANFYSRL